MPSVAIPTVDEIRAESNVEWAEYGYPLPVGADPDRLDTVLSEATIEFQAMTGIDPADEPVMAADVRAPLIRKAIRMLVEFNAGASQMEVLESVTDFDIISSFGAAGYNETRRNVSANTQVVHPWPALNRLLKFIVYFDSAGQRAMDVPGVEVPGLTPNPYEWVIDPYGRYGMFDPPTVPLGYFGPWP